jgi:quinol monooxygenase YgiN
MIGKALLFRFESQTDEDSMDTFLEDLSAEVSWEKNTLAWFGLRYMRGEFGVIAYFRDEEGRQAHLNGSAAAKFFAAEHKLMTAPPTTHKLDILAAKMPPNLQDVTKGLVLRFKAKAGHEAEVVQFLKDCLPWAEKESGTLAWFAHQYDDSNFGVFGVFADNAHRFAYLTGHIPREAAKRAFTIFGGMPEMHLVDVMTGSARLEQAA